MNTRGPESAPPELSSSLRARGANPAHARPIPRLALSPVEAAASLGCSRDYFDEHVLPELRVVRRGRKVLVSVAELERWLRENAALTLDR
jgi:excisionase family DNA binding protein